MIGGRVVRMMAGARWEHASIVQNIARRIGNSLDDHGRDCMVFTETFYMKQKALDAHLLPDVTAVCGDLEPGATSTSEPVVLVEVVSVGTEARDRLEKWHVYQRLPSLQHYVLVARDRPHVEVFGRIDGAWTGMQVMDGLGETLTLTAIDTSLALSDIYRRVF